MNKVITFNFFSIHCIHDCETCDEDNCTLWALLPSDGPLEAYGLEEALEA